MILMGADRLPTYLPIFSSYKYILTVLLYMFFPGVDGRDGIVDGQRLDVPPPGCTPLIIYSKKLK